MISKHQYYNLYPHIANFNSNPNSPTYTRRSKTGKTVVVRKGKRFRQAINTPLGAGVLAGSVVGVPGAILARKAIAHPNAGMKTAAILGAGAAAAPLLVGIGGYQIIKKYRD